MVICVIIGCGSRSGRDDVSFYRIPCVNMKRNYKNSELILKRQKLWIARTKRKDLDEKKIQHARICHLHFISGKPSTLKDVDDIDWAPSINLGYENEKTGNVAASLERYQRENESNRKKPKCHICSKQFSTFSDVLEHLKTKHTSWFRNIEYISCCISGCQSKSRRKVEYNPEIEEEYIPMFPVPRIGKLFKQWKEALKGTETELTWDDHICERHFLENDIERYYKTKTESGDIIEIKKILPTLKPDAVPIKFLKPSVYQITKDYTRPSKRLQSASQNSIVLNCERNLCDKSNLALNSLDSVDCAVDKEIETCYDSSVDSLTNTYDSSVTSILGQVSQETKCLLYSELVKNIQLVKKPSKFWSVVCTDQFIIFARWNNDFIAEKRLVIESSFTIKVFLKNWEIEMTDLVDITSSDDVTSLLEKVENYDMDLRC